MIDEAHPNVVRFDNKLFVSLRPATELAAQLAAQRAWDDANARANHWAWAIGIGAAAGSAATFVATWFLGAPPVINLFLLPVGFAIGAVVGGRINESLRSRRPADAALGARPTSIPMVKIPRRVAATADRLSTAQELIDLSSPDR
jgi:hypothetical protein